MTNGDYEFVLKTIPSHLFYWNNDGRAANGGHVSWSRSRRDPADEG